MTNASTLWDRYCKYLYSRRDAGFALDISRMRFEEDFLDRMSGPIEKAIAAMDELDHGAVANADENRMVGHYWLRNPTLAPTEQISADIINTRVAVSDFARGVHAGQIRGSGGPFEHCLLVGIGGSALGPQFVAHALGTNDDPITPHFVDNTDPDGIDRVVARLSGHLDRTIVVVTSKSGGTPETRNGMLEIQNAYKRAGIPFGPHAVAVTQAGSNLDKVAVAENWLARFPMYDWVGGRTSVMSAVGLVPASLQGLDIGGMLDGAASMDELTRETNFRRNPAALLALMWYYAGGGRGTKDMVILPYKDRLELFSKYLQQLVMESLGKELDRDGKTVHQGIAVYGNKGSTDQHAYVQQLRDGVPNFFVTFIEVLNDREGTDSIQVEEGVTSGDYLNGLLQGTRRALFENGRDSITITIDAVTPASVGGLIALYERAVGLYAELVNINAYHQPGVEAGKKAAKAVLDLQTAAVAALADRNDAMTAGDLAAAIGHPSEAETVFKVLRHLSANQDRKVASNGDERPSHTLFRIKR